MGLIIIMFKIIVVHFTFFYSIVTVFARILFLHLENYVFATQRCDWWYFLLANAGTGSLSVWSLVCATCTVELLCYGAAAFLSDTVLTILPKKLCHILSALLRTTLHSLTNWCKCVNVELKTIKMYFMHKGTFEATGVCFSYLKARRGKMFRPCQSLCSVLTSWLSPCMFWSKEHLIIIYQPSDPPIKEKRIHYALFLSPSSNI